MTSDLTVTARLVTRQHLVWQATVWYKGKSDKLEQCLPRTEMKYTKLLKAF